MPDETAGYRATLEKIDAQLLTNTTQSATITENRDSLIAEKERLEKINAEGQADAEHAASVASMIANTNELHSRRISEAFLAQSFLLTGAPRVANTTAVQALIKALVVEKVFQSHRGYHLSSDSVEAANQLPSLLNLCDETDVDAGASFAADLAYVESLLTDDLKPPQQPIYEEVASDSNNALVEQRMVTAVVAILEKVYRADLLEADRESDGKLYCLLLKNASSSIIADTYDDFTILYEFHGNFAVLKDIAPMINGHEGKDAAEEATHLLATSLISDSAGLGMATMIFDKYVCRGRAISTISMEELTFYAGNASTELYEGISIHEIFAYVSPVDSVVSTVEQQSLLLLLAEMCQVTDLYVKENHDASDNAIVEKMLGEVNTVRKAILHGIFSFVSEEIDRRAMDIGSEDVESAATEEMKRISERIEQQLREIQEKQDEMQETMDKIQERKDQADEIAKSAKEKMDTVTDEITAAKEELAKAQAAVEEAKKNTEEANKALEESEEKVEEAEAILAELQKKEAELQAEYDDAMKDKAEAEAEEIKAATEEENKRGEHDTMEELVEESQGKLDELQDWQKFVQAVYNAFTLDPTVVGERKVVGDQLRQKMDTMLAGDGQVTFGWVFDILEACTGFMKDKSEAESEGLSPQESEDFHYRTSDEFARWKAKALENEAWGNDLYQVLDGVLTTTVKRNHAENVMIVESAALTWGEVIHNVKENILARLNIAGLEFDKYGHLKLKSPHNDFSWYDLKALSPLLHSTWTSRFQIFFQHKNENSSTKPYWKELHMTGAELDEPIARLNSEGYGLKMEDVIRCFARKLQVVATHQIVLDESITLPGIDLSVGSGRAGIHFKSRDGGEFIINTSGKTCLPMRNPRALGGAAYQQNSREGRSGDDGINGLAGMHGGHIVFFAKEFIGMDGMTGIKTNGAVGQYAQKGGHGAPGKAGATGKSAKAHPIDTWTGAQYRLAWGQYPGVDQNGEADQRKENERGGRGGNGGISGVSGPSGLGGDVAFGDEDGIFYRKLNAEYLLATENDPDVKSDESQYLDGKVTNDQLGPTENPKNDGSAGDGGEPGQDDTSITLFILNFSQQQHHTTPHLPSLNTLIPCIKPSSHTPPPHCRPRPHPPHPPSPPHPRPSRLGQLDGVFAQKRLLQGAEAWGTNSRIFQRR